MYHVNSGVPKTLVKHLIQWMAGSSESTLSRILKDIAETPISPELLPLGSASELLQKSEETVGPFVLNDFFLYYLVRYSFSPDKIEYLARIAFAGKYEMPAIRHGLAAFLQRFIRAQFKRSSMPDGPKVGSVALSPRSDWRMPSDINLWLSTEPSAAQFSEAAKGSQRS